MTKANLAKKLQLECFGHIMRLCDLEESSNNVTAAISRFPQSLNLVDRSLGASIDTRLDNGLDSRWMRLIADFKDVCLINVSKARMRRLQVVERIPHVAFGGKYDCLEAIVCIRHLFGFTDLSKTSENLFVAQSTVTQNGGTRLNRLDNLGRDIACQGKASRIGVNFHGASKGLLSCLGHGISFIQNDNLVPNIDDNNNKEGCVRMNDKNVVTRTSDENGQMTYRPGGRVTLFMANPLILLRTT